MLFRYYYILLLLVVLYNDKVNDASNETSDSISLLTTQISYVAGDHITLEFSEISANNIHLICSNSFGTTVLKPNPENDITKFKIPKIFSSKSGIIHWELIANDILLQGQLTINPKAIATSIESYIGPPSIEAGGTDFAMLVTIPTDEFDNPLADGTTVKGSHQFLSNITTDSLTIGHMIAYNNIYSDLESGRILVTSECSGLNAKEHTINVNPAIPSEFTIDARRSHDFADGNQITSFESSIIKDKNNNIISDGTYVQFYIETHDGKTLQTSGLTVNGIAKAQMIHPDKQSSWSVKAFIEGMAESNELRLEYRPVIADFQYSLSDDGRSIVVGPFKSFMNQLIPDGLEVSLLITQNNTNMLKMTRPSQDGYVRFMLRDDIVPKGNYSIELRAAGIKKQQTQVSVW